MNEDLIKEMRELLWHHARSPHGLPACFLIFSEHPQETDEILQRLLAEYDSGKPADLDIHALIAVRRSAHKRPSPARAAAMQQIMDECWSYASPPTCERVMYVRLLGAAYGLKEGAGAKCADMVREYPEAADALLAELVIEQRHDHFYSGVLDTGVQVDALRSMIARTRSSDILAEIERKMA